MGMFDSVVVGLYLLFVFYVGIRFFKSSDSFESYALGTRKYSWWVIMATLSASFIGGGFSMGVASKVFLFGIIHIVGMWGFSLKEIWVSKYVAPRMSQFPDALTVGDIAYAGYGKPAKVLAGILGGIMCAGIVGVQVNAIGYVFQVFYDVPLMTGILLAGGLVIFYTLMGGMGAIVITDIVQFVLLIVGIPITLFFGIQALGGTEVFFEQASVKHLSLGSGGLIGIKEALLLSLTFLLGETLVPPYVQRLLMGRSDADVEKGTLWSGILSIPFFVVVGLLGIVAYQLNPGIDSGLAIPYVVKTVVPVGLKSLIIVGILSAVMSSADSFLHATVTSLVHDVVKPLKKTVTNELSWARMMTLVIGVLGIIAATQVPSLLDLCIYSWTFWAPMMVVPLLGIVFGYTLSRRSFWWCVGLSAALTIYLTQANFNLEVDILIVGIAFHALLYVGFYLKERA